MKLTKLAKTFGSRIELGLGPEGPWIDAKSIVKVMARKGAAGHARCISAPTATMPTTAVAALVGLVERDFDEAGADAAGG